MGRTILIACAALLAAGCGPRIIDLDIQAMWFGCERQRECTIVEDPRCGLMPINRRYADSYVAWVRRHHADEVKSAPCARNAFRYDAICEDARCSSNLVRHVLTAANSKEGQ